MHSRRNSCSSTSRSAKRFAQMRGGNPFGCYRRTSAGSQGRQLDCRWLVQRSEKTWGPRHVRAPRRSLFLLLLLLLLLFFVLSTPITSWTKLGLVGAMWSASSFPYRNRLWAHELHRQTPEGLSGELCKRRRRASPKQLRGANPLSRSIFRTYLWDVVQISKMGPRPNSS